MKLNVPFILASRSPRRSHLLTSTGFTFQILPSDREETNITGESPQKMAARLASEKASHIASTSPSALVLGADTIVILDDKILGKPADEQDARRMLSTLSGRSHQVITGISLQHLASERVETRTESTIVTMGAISTDQIDRYVASGSPLDKAGSYGIQDEGAFFVQRIEGDFYNVMGLPLHLLYLMLTDKFQDLIAN